MTNVQSSTAAQGAADNNHVSAKVGGFGVAYAITCVLSAIVVLLKEEFPAIHDAFAAITGHHWVTHGLLDIIIFFVLGTILAKRDNMRMTGDSLIRTVVGGTVIGGLIIVGFFLLEA